MILTLSFFLNSILLGTGLAMDAFSVSVANALAEPTMKKRKMGAIAGTFSFFQFFMPLLGWICVHTFVKRFQTFAAFIPYIAFVLLTFIGAKMIYETIKNREKQQEHKRLTAASLILQGIATSIDALSVGFTIEQYDFLTALTACALIGGVTFIICAVGLLLGKKFAKYFSKAEIIGGVILIGIGLEILIKGVCS